MNQKINKIAICFLAVAILAGTAYLFINIMPSKNNSEDETAHEHDEFIVMTPEQIQEERITIHQAGPAILQNTVYASGRVTFNSHQLMHIVPKASGVVKEARKNIGDTIAKGEILVILDSQEMAEAKSSFIDKLQKEQQAVANLDREKILRDKQIASEQDLQNRQAEANQASLELELARQKLHIIGLTPKEISRIQEGNIALRYYELRSPISGTIVDKKIIPGEHISTTDEIYVIADLQTLGAELKVFPKDAQGLSIGQTVEITCPYGHACTGSIISISPLVDPDTHTLTVYASIDNSDQHWKPGSYISAHILADTETAAVAVPTEAIQKIENEDCVFVAKETGFEIRPIKKGRSDDSHVEIISGLSPEEPYASSNTFILKAEHGKDEAQHMD